MSTPRTLEIPVRGMDCAECTQHVRLALATLPGVESVEVYLASEKAVLLADPAVATMPKIRQAVAEAGYQVPEDQPAAAGINLTSFTRPLFTLLALVFGATLFIVVVGEWLGLFRAVSDRIPWFIGLAVVLLGGYPVFLNVIRAAMRKQVISHTLMTLGVIAAIAVGEWITAAVVVFFMRVGEYAERFTTERARRAVKDLTRLAPQTARVERDGNEVEIPAAEVQISEVVVVRPGERIPVDGDVLTGQATINQAAITGEAMPVEAGPGTRVFAASIAQLGSLRIRTLAVGRDTTFGRVIQLVEEAEANRADVQRIADRFSAYYLPVVALIGLLTLVLRRDPLAAAAVLVVACSCSFALATPIAMLASVGAAARRGLLIKGGKYIETLARADTLLVDKTGTLTLGQPVIHTVVSLNGASSDEVLSLAAALERYSEHPLAQAVRTSAQEKGLAVPTVEDFSAQPGVGVRGQVNGQIYRLGSRRMLNEPMGLAQAAELEAQGSTLLWLLREDKPIGLLAAADQVRPEAPAAIRELAGLGITHVELLTGDQPAAAARLASELGIPYRAGLLPEDKIAVVRELQAQGKRVIMVGDGVNDAPALAQADIGIAMGVAGSDIAVETAHIALMREDWSSVPELIRIARRTMRVVRTNIAFTAVYNLVGLSLAAFGILPPVLAAAAQSLPDLGILANSSRLIRQ